MERGGGITHTHSKPPEDSPMTQEESDDIFFRVSKLEDLIRGYERTINLFNLEERMDKKIEEGMEHMEERIGHKIEENKKIHVKLI